ncbi:restriction endonuclease subunit S [Leptospira kanakyensis]|uniref:restriction endonuclease subunit S n=1 Tax=Leptospira kanakyensis TaxID=2484968 RepID=UPI00223DFC43|nr:restriction endonuclease subunit S [Leptospira kanakyensis]MCW7482275.1 restriction endonuclease subunit S [Leptospira kanakyensis]
MKRYEAYKDSGVEWIGEIPAHWELKRLKWVAEKIQTGSTPPSSQPEYYIEEMNWYTPSDFNDKLELNSSNRKISNSAIFDGVVKVIPENSVLFVGIGATLGKVAFIREAACANQQINGISFVDIGKAKFYTFYFLSAKIHIVALANSATLPILNQSQMKDLKTPLPPLAEQTSIAEFLDRKTSQIDSLVEKKKRLIELLKEEKAAVINRAVTKGIDPNVKMKDSGVEWLGEIPEHWEVKKLKWVADLNGRIGFRGYTTSDLVGELEGAISLSPSNMINGKLETDKSTYLSWEKYYESPEIIVEPEDVLMVKTGSTFGKIALVERVDYPMTINPQITIFKKIKCVPRYLFYFLSSEFIQNLISITNSGSTIPTISQERILDIVIFLPSKSDQVEIVNYIQRKSIQIDSTISKIEKEIELLQEYRTALISEVVTGKVRVG